MKNIIYERDYSHLFSLSSDEGTEMEIAMKKQIYDYAKQHGVFQKFRQVMASVPKVVIPEQKANFEILLQKAEQLAMKYGGKLHGEVKYDMWESVIILILPFLEFVDQDEYDFLKSVANLTNHISITATKDGGIRIRVMIDYFSELFEKETTSADILDSIIMEDQYLVQMLDTLYEVHQRNFVTSVSNLLGLLNIEGKYSADELPNVITNFVESDSINYGALLLTCLSCSA